MVEIVNRPHCCLQSLRAVGGISDHLGFRRLVRRGDRASAAGRSLGHLDYGRFTRARGAHTICPRVRSINTYSINLGCLICCASVVRNRKKSSIGKENVHVIGSRPSECLSHWLPNAPILRCPNPFFASESPHLFIYLSCLSVATPLPW